MARISLLVIFDDMNTWVDPLCGHPDSITPNMAELADGATLFSRAYCTAPYCNASRFGIFTGLYPHQNGVYGNDDFWARGDRPKLLMEAARESGVRCFAAGKVMHGVFDYEGANRSGATKAKWLNKFNRMELWDDFCDPQNDPLPAGRPLSGLFSREELAAQPKHYQLFDWGRIDAPPNEFPDTRATDWLIERLGQFSATPSDEPALFILGLSKPHLPWYTPRDLPLRSHEVAPQTPLVKRDDLADAPPIARAWVNRFRDHELVLRHGQWRHAVRNYLACIEFADWQLGRLLKALRELSLYDECEIIVTSDNGFHLGEKLHWRKFVLWEEATRVPLIHKASNQTAKRIDNTPKSLAHVFDILVDNFDLNNQLDQSGLLSTRKAWDADQYALSTWTRDNHSIRSADYRYTLYSDGCEELFDHRIDPREWRNLAEDRAYQSVKTSLRDHLNCLLDAGRY